MAAMGCADTVRSDAKLEVRDAVVIRDAVLVVNLLSISEWTTKVFLENNAVFLTDVVLASVVPYRPGDVSVVAFARNASARIAVDDAWMSAAIWTDRGQRPPGSLSSVVRTAEIASADWSPAVSKGAHLHVLRCYQIMNESGTNQFQGFPETIPYGEKSRQGMLSRLAPVAGDSAAAIGAPRRDQRATQRPGRAAQPLEAAPPMLPPLAQPAQLPPQQLFASIASIPGASPTVQAVFGGGA